MPSDMNRNPFFLRAERIWKIYDSGAQRLEVLKDISLDIEEGSLTAICGPSGAGKTTLLHLLSGMDRPSRGRVWLGSHELSKMRETDQSRLINESVGFVFQFYHLLSDLTVFENVMLPAQIRPKMPKKAMRDRVSGLLSEVGLSDRGHHYPSQLSGGEQQRVAIIRSVMNDPKIIFCDEPTGNLDSETGQVVCRYLKKLCTQYHKTVLIVTHDDKIAQIAERILHLKDGQWVTHTAAVDAHDTERMKVQNGI